ncbi:MAG: putative toxin-antitoxin system toxin component, PIN family [Candidatus Saganbacteria bacterium]|nr:putative toxin-antitoxin system toxin component, PIN family [Candidatus Saganbacteria bacterium]
MLKVVIDTNIFVAGLTWGGLPGEIVDSWLAGKIKLVISPQIIEEIVRTLKKLKVPDPKVSELQNQLLSKTILVDPQIKINLVEKDSSDNKFLECAVEGRTDFIKTGDNHLLSIKEIRGIKILKARRFLDQL